MPTLFYIVAALTATACAMSAVASQDDANNSLMSEAQLAHWLATTDAKLTFIGPPPNSNPLSPRSAENTVVTYCSKRIGSCCGGECTVYNGGAACIDTPHTECMAATKDVGYCDRKGCNGNCNDLAACGTKLKDGFCYTYSTESIVTSIL